MATYNNLSGDDEVKALKLPFAVVGKRHNARFYANDKKASYDYYDKQAKSKVTNGILNPDLLVENAVTTPRRQFIICSLIPPSRAPLVSLMIMC